MDPLCSVFSITGSDTGSMNGDILVHPGDSASPLEVIEWLPFPVRHRARVAKLTRQKAEAETQQPRAKDKNTDIICVRRGK